MTYNYFSWVTVDRSLTLGYAHLENFVSCGTLQENDAWFVAIRFQRFCHLSCIPTQIVPESTLSSFFVLIGFQEEICMFSFKHIRQCAYTICKVITMEQIIRIY